MFCPVVDSAKWELSSKPDVPDQIPLIAAINARCCAALLAGAAFFWDNGAAAQWYQRGYQQGAVLRDATVTARPRPDYAPLGVRLGGFRLDGEIEGGAGYNDNLVPDARRRRGGVFLDEALRLDLNSTWTRHAFNATVAQAARRYLADSELDWTDYEARLGGRLDIGRASSVTAGYVHQRGHLDVTEFDVSRGALGRPISFEVDAASIAGAAAINRVTLTGALDHNETRFDRADLRSGTDAATVSALDYGRTTGEAGATYSFTPGRSVTLLTRLTDITYRQSERQGRSSFTWEVLGGVRYDLTGLWALRLALGYRQRNYEGPGLPTLSGPALEGEVLYLPTQLTTVTLSARRSIEESIRTDSVAFTRTYLRLGVDHELFRNVLLSGEIRGEHLEYERPRDTVTGIVGLVGLRVYLDRRISVSLSYQREERLHAPAGAQEFDQNLVRLRMRFAL